MTKTRSFLCIIKDVLLLRVQFWHFEKREIFTEKQIAV